MIMAENITISLAAEKDIEAISQIAHKISLYHYENLKSVFKKREYETDREYIVKTIREGKSLVIKAEIEMNVICGYAVLGTKTLFEKVFVEKVVGVIDDLGVDEKYRKKGVASKLLKFAENHFKNQGINVIGLNCYTFNTSANSFYDKMGYENVKVYKEKRIK